MRQLHAGAQRHLHEMRHLREHHRMQLGPLNRNMLFLIVGALIVVVAVLAYQLYQDRKEPKGTQINIGPSGITIEKK
jgi:hypothetical protein